PPFDIPPASHTVSVSIINTTATIRGIPTTSFFEPHIKGHDFLAAPCFSFLIQRHTPTSDRSLLFDLGIRKDFQNLPPSLLSHFRELNWSLSVESSVSDIISPTVPLQDIEAIILSHHHFDHIADPSVFPPTTALVVGPGFKQSVTPGYPTDSTSPVPESSLSNREVIELDFSDYNRWKIVDIGPSKAIDYFEDGSFYLLDAPGHVVGHVCALARVTSSLGVIAPGKTHEEDSFVLLAGDAIHHPGELRPSEWVPLPGVVKPSPFGDGKGEGEGEGCPGAMFDGLLTGGRTTPFYKAVGPWHSDFDALRETVRKLQRADGMGNVLVLAAHDESLLDVVEFFPKNLNGFLKEGWGEKLRWRFLRDFGEAVGK
ncbi:beta-lactamase-like protein, partial [Cercophora newfieldiana]